MKVLHITGEYPPYVLGGLGTYVKEIVLELKNLGLDVEVLVLNGDLKKYNEIKVEKIEGINVTHKYFNPYEFKNINNKILSTNDVIKQFNLQKFIKIPYNVIHVHDWYGSLWGAAIKAQTGAKLVFTSHLPTRAGFTYTGHSVSTKIKMQLESLAIRFADIILCPSQSVSDTLINEYNANFKKVFVLPNGINSDTFFSKLKRNINIKHPTILSVARLTEQKGLHYLFDVIVEVKKKKPDILCNIVGTGTIKKSLEKEVERLGIKNNVNFLGHKNHNELSQIYQKSDLFISTSIYEPFGLVILEAMASGTPVISFAVGGIKEIIFHKKNGLLVDPGNTKKMAKTIINILSSEKEMKKIRNAGLETIDKYNWKKISIKLNHIYESLCEN